MAQVAVLRAQNRANNKGSDPRLATCRGKLQSRRSKINSDINKEFRMRTGAENLFRATNNKKLKNTVALELSFVNSNLQLLREKLISVNGNLDIYQGISSRPVMPMIPLGLKETKDIDFRETFKDFILEHYSEDADKYEKTILEFMELREAVKTPTRDENGIILFMQYFNQLIFVERRFFPPNRIPSIFFEWYDSFIGIPSCQRSIALEKASVLFNMAALHTQIGAKQDRSSDKGLDQSVDSYLRAAGTFGYIRDNFSNPPSIDLNPQIMTTLIKLMLAQAKECLFIKLELQSESNRDIDVSLDLAQESAHVSEWYGDVLHDVKMEDVKKLVPCLWVALINIKCEHYAAIAHYHAAVGMLSKPLTQLNANTIRLMQLIHAKPINESFTIPISDEQRRQYGNAHAKSALIIQEQAERILRICRELRNIKHLTSVISRVRELTVDICASIEEDVEFGELFDTPELLPSTKIHLRLTAPEFGHIRVKDLFHALGPLSIFSAKHLWTAPRTIQLQKLPNSNGGFGFSVKGDAPVIIGSIERGSSAYYANMKMGDFIVSINDKDVKWAKHYEVVKLIKDAGDRITLKLITPMDKNYLKPEKKSSGGSVTSKGDASNNSTTSSESSTSSSIGGVAGSRHSRSTGSLLMRRRLPWTILFKKNRDKRQTTRSDK